MVRFVHYCYKKLNEILFYPLDAFLLYVIV